MVGATAGKLVVVIDNDPLVLDGMGGLLRSWGCQVVTGEWTVRRWPRLDAQRAGARI